MNDLRPMPTLSTLGARKVGRPLSEDHAYAEELGCSYRVIMRHGGAARLKRLPEEARNLLLWPAVVKFDRKSLTARGMTAQPPVQKLFRPGKTSWCVDRFAVAKHIFERLDSTCRTSRLIPPHCPTDRPLEALLADEDFELPDDLE